jgi:hypothetical protein
MTTTVVRPTESHLPDVSGQQLNFDTWKERGEELVGDFRTKDAALEMDQWKIGDWIVQGVDKFAEKKGKQQVYDEAMRITGFDREYLQTVVWVVRRFPVSSLRKESTLKWSHFKEMAYLKDEKTRQRVLDKYSDGLPHSVRVVRECVLQELARPKQGGSGKKRNFKHVYMHVEFTLARRAQIKQLATARRITPDALVRKIIEEYFQQNKTEISEALEKLKVRSKKRL